MKAQDLINDYKVMPFTTTEAKENNQEGWKFALNYTARLQEMADNAQDAFDFIKECGEEVPKSEFAELFHKKVLRKVEKWNPVTMVTELLTESKDVSEKAGANFLGFYQVDDYALPRQRTVFINRGKTVAYAVEESINNNRDSSNIWGVPQLPKK
jgi:hypothetical protein